MSKIIRFKLNGQPEQLKPDPTNKRMLLWALRKNYDLVGSKHGCGSGYCGSCTVLVDNEAVRSCQYPVNQLEGKEVLTIEGLAVDGKLHPLQQAFVTHDAMQCGFCTSGMILNAYGLILKNPALTRKEIIEGMEGNLCRCGAYGRIIDAIQAAAMTMNKLGRNEK